VISKHVLRTARGDQFPNPFEGPKILGAAIDEIPGYPQAELLAERIRCPSQKLVQLVRTTLNVTYEYSLHDRENPFAPKQDDE
jgi:hypothetical protein